MSYTVNLGCWGSIFAVPSDVVDKYLKIAGSAQLKVLLWILRHSGENFEVDTIADWNKTFAIEIKSLDKPEKKLATNTKKYLELLNDTSAKNAVFYLGDTSMTINGTMYVGWKDWGDYLEQ